MSADQAVRLARGGGRVDLRVPVGEVYGVLGDTGRAWPSPALSRIGALIEGPAFYPYLSGRENLRAGPARGEQFARQSGAFLLGLVDSRRDPDGDAFGVVDLCLVQPGVAQLR